MEDFQEAWFILDGDIAVAVFFDPELASEYATDNGFDIEEARFEDNVLN